MNINLGARVVYLNLLGPSSGIESLCDPEKVLCNVTLLLLRFLYTEEADKNL